MARQSNKKKRTVLPKQPGTQIQSEKQETAYETYSYHTFMYTFFWNPDADPVNMIKQLGQRWLVDYVEEGQNFSTLKDKPEELKNILQKYGEYHYFFEKARRMILNTDSMEHDVMHWRMNLDHNCEENKYVILLTSPSEKTEHDPEDIRLHLEGVKLSLYPKLSIGILTIETEYRPEPKDPQKYNNVLAINDLGRRIFSPSYMSNGCGPCTAAQIRLSLKLGENTEEETIVFRLDWAFTDGYNSWNGADLGIRHLLFGEPPNEQSEKPRGLFGTKHKKEKALIIKPIFDDRMFTACILKDTQWTQHYIDFLTHSDRQNGEEKYLFDEKRLYEFLFCDRYDNCSCQDHDLRQRLINEHVYSRWIDYKSVYGITEYSLTYATTDTVEKDAGYLVDNFLTIYIDLAKLVLLQRAAIISLEARVSAYSAGDRTDEPTKIWQDYIYFQSSMMLPEASFQQQGVEMYDMLWECLQIQRYSDYLDNEIHSFSEHARFLNDKQDEERDKRVENFSLIISLILAFSLFIDAYEGVRAIQNEKILSFADCFSHTPVVIAGILVVLIVILSICILVIGRNKKGRKKE